MRPFTLFAVAIALFFSQPCFGLMISVRGNEPQVEANYASWPGLIRVVNDPSRVLLVWVNGNENLYYRGDAAALNRVLKAFGEAEISELRVVLRPVPLAPANADKENEPYDWQLHIVGGIVRAMAERQRTEAIIDWHPTLTIFVSKRIDLNAIDVPRHATLQQLEDLRARYQVELRIGSDESKAEAAQLLDALNADGSRPQQEARDFQRQMDEIREFVRKWEADK